MITVSQNVSGEWCIYHGETLIAKCTTQSIAELIREDIVFSNNYWGDDLYQDTINISNNATT